LLCFEIKQLNDHSLELEALLTKATLFKGDEKTQIEVTAFLVSTQNTDFDFAMKLIQWLRQTVRFWSIKRRYSNCPNMSHVHKFIPNFMDKPASIDSTG